MSNESLSALREFAADLAWQAGKLTMRYFQTDFVTETKEDLSPVTIADRSSERLMRELIETHYPHHSILGEEEGETRPGASFRWILDPARSGLALVMSAIGCHAQHLGCFVTGREIGPTLELARRLAARKRPMWVRFVLVPGLTDDLDDIKSIAEFAAGLGNVDRVEVLPFHQMGRFKWKELGIKYHLEQTQPPTAEAVEKACGVFRAAGLHAPS